MQTLRYTRLAAQLNQTALALIAEARIAQDDEARELQELAAELDRVRVAMLAKHRQDARFLTYNPATAA